MTKVEELREQLVRCTIDACLSCENSKDCESYACILTGHDEVDSNREIEHEKATAMAVQLVDALIAAVREDEREKIAENGQHFELGDDVSGSDYLTCVHLQPEVDVDVSVIAEEDCYIVPASVLAPKESEP